MIVDNPAVCISVYKDVFNPDNFINRLEKTIDNGFGEELSWDVSRVGNGENSQYRTSLSCSMTTLLPPYPEDDELASVFRKEIYRPTINVVNDYVEEHRLINGAHELISVLKYSGMAEYHAHHDHSPDSRRIFSLVACLGESEEGGELEFPNFDVKIKLNSGSVILFPSNFPYTHIAHPVISGTKYSMVTWFQ
jgi:hypothetical protein